MAEGRIKRKIVWEKSGVSEIIGTILMLSLTVVLFSGIITMVGLMPAPRQTVSIDLKCSIRPHESGWAHGANFSILHQGGQVMDDMWTMIYISVDGKFNSTALRVRDGLHDLNGDGKWNMGERWEVLITERFVNSTITEDSLFTVTIIDQERNTLVWYETVGKATHTYSPIIMRAWIDSDTTTPLTVSGPITFTDPFLIYAEVVDPQAEIESVFVNLEPIYRNGSAPVQLLDVFVDPDSGIQYGHGGDNVYLALCQPPPRTTSVGYYQFVFNATNSFNQSTQASFRFPVGAIIMDDPQIWIKPENIAFSNPQPSNGDTIRITATVSNTGNKSASVEVTFYDNDNTTMIGTQTISVAQGGQTDARVDWAIRSGGNHTIIVEAWPIDGVDLYPEDNVANRSISVMPRILLVDDDQYVADLSVRDTVSPMRASLEATGFSYDFTRVGAGDGPRYDSGDYPLVNYDIVIWMTGYRETGTLTIEDVQNLKYFLDGHNTSGQGGSLWLISQGFWQEAQSLVEPGPTLRAFARNYLRVPDNWIKDGPLPATLHGNETHPVTDYFHANPVPTKELVPGTDEVFSWGIGSVDEDAAAFLGADGGRVYALTYDSDKNATDMIRDSRRLSQTFDFSRITDTAAQAQYAFKAILWLGNITMKFAEDIALSSISVIPERVFFQQTITVSFTVRNNGFVTYPAGTVEYLLRIYDMSGNDVIIPRFGKLPDTLATGSDNTVTVQESWTPDRLGYHRIWIMLDPYYKIEESNKENNVLSSYWGRGEFNVQYRVLIVDDDESPNNGGANNHETGYVTAAMDYLNQTAHRGYTYEFEQYTVMVDQDGPGYNAEDGKPGLSEYNAVIWVGGSAAQPLTHSGEYNDVANITEYMKLGRNFWFMGTGLDNDVYQVFRHDYLKIASLTPDQGTGDRLLGALNDPISHGMDFPTLANETGADDLVPVAGDGIAGFTSREGGGYNSVRCRATVPVDGIAPYRAVTTAWSLSNLNSEMHSAEFVFMVLRWFDKPEARVEARITDADMWISNDRPQIGSGYVIRATVHNTGGATANVLARFMDGNTQIGSSSVSVSPGGRTTAEMIWVPLFAGERTISVLLDPINEVEEIFEWSNNNATRTTTVFFFWDNMESGAGKWTRGSTIMRISGEGALEYFHETELHTHVESEWDWGFTDRAHVLNISDPGFYHSYDKAFWLQEPPGGNASSGTRAPTSEGVMAGPEGTMPMATETRFMRGVVNEATVNGLTTYSLNLTQSNTLGTHSILSGPNVDVNTCWGIKIYLRNSAETQVALYGGTVRAIVNRAAGSTGSDLQSATFTPPTVQPLNMTDSIVIEIWSGLNTATPNTNTNIRFTTEQLGAEQLDAETWTVWYHTERSYGGGPPARTTGRFSWGTLTYNSRIENFTHSVLADTIPPEVESTVPDDGDTNVATDMTVQVTFNEPMDTTIEPTLIYISGDPGGGWTFSGWQPDGRTAVWAHATFWGQGITVTLEVSGAYDEAGNMMTAPYRWSFTTATGATATATGPKGPSNNAAVTITYSYVGVPDSVNLYYSRDNGASWDFAGNDATVDGSFAYNIVGGEGAYYWLASAVGGNSTEPSPPDAETAPEAGPYIYDITRPTVVSRSPANGAVEVPVDEYIVLVFSEPMRKSSVTVSFSPNPGGILHFWSDGDTKLTIAHKNFPGETLITVTVNQARDLAGNDLDPTPDPWSFTTAEGGAGGIDWTQLGLTPEGPNFNKSAVTPAFSLNDLGSARLSFWHKYNLLAGKNGAFLQVGYIEAGAWKWFYVTPANAYTGNLDPNQLLLDDHGAKIYWCWNGVSGRGTFGWDNVQMDLLSVRHLIPAASRDQVRVKFNYTQWGNGTGYGWYIDDVTVTVTRASANATAGDRDLWEMVNVDKDGNPLLDRFGNPTTAWRNVDPDNHNLTAAGLDNYLMTQPIDLTNARTAYLSAYVKFNFNTQSGGPPDGFRIEVSKNNGITWEPINLGVRASWGVSGTEDPGAGGKSYTGVNEGGNWVNVNSLTRVTTDLSSFSGNVVLIRFRLVTNAHDLYQHYEDAGAGFGGFYIDDVQVEGETILT